MARQRRQPEQGSQLATRGTSPEPVEGELLTGGPRSYRVLKPMTNNGKHLVDGDTVKLNDRQAERLSASGHIQQ